MNSVDFFDRMFKTALIYGMTSQEFWFGNPQDYFVYQDAFAEKKKNQHEEDDIRAWLYGQYNLLAFRQSMSEAFAKKGSSHKNIFPEKPFSIKEEKNTLRKKKEEDGKSLAIKILAMARSLGGVIQK